MSVKLKQLLSDHEQSRYYFLKKSVIPLTDKQMEELSYLEAKLEGAVFNTPSQEPPLERRTKRRVKTAPSRSEAVTKPKKPLKTRPKTGTKPAKLTHPPKNSGCFGRLLKGFISLMLVLLLAMSAMFVKGMLGIGGGQDKLQPALTEYFAGQKTRDGVNILILGSDKRVTEESTEARTDTIMVVNIGNRSGQVKLVSFMRDTLVNIEGYSYSDTYDYKLNSAFTLGEQDNNRGAELMRRTLKANFDIDIEYYAMIDFETFALAVDTLFPNGVYMDAQFSTIEGEVVNSVEVPDDLGENLSTGLYQTIAVGPQQMDGKTLLNYARFRGDDEGDNGRTRRQQEVMQAIIAQVKDPTILFTGSEALGKIYSLTSTNISFPFVLKNGLSGLTAAQNGIQRMTIPEQGDWVDAYDSYGGQGLLIDFEAYQYRLEELGLR